MSLIPDTYTVNAQLDNGTLLKLGLAIMALIIISWALNYFLPPQK